MIILSELRKIALNRIKESELLYSNNKFDGSIYLCGYSVETALKFRICKTLKWLGFPETNNEFKSLQSFKTHDFTILLKLSGYEDKIISTLLPEWSTVCTWNPELRYKQIGSTAQSEAKDIISSSKVLVIKLCGK